jgi:hypothetical protein
MREVDSEAYTNTGGQKTFILILGHCGLILLESV